MTDDEVFENLFEKASGSKDPRGVVSACLFKEGKILFSFASADDGVRHAEDLLLKYIRVNNISISEEMILYSTLEPCTKRSNPILTDCTSLIIKSNIKNIVYGASDPDHSEITKERFLKENINMRQVANPNIIKKCAEIFNNSVKESNIKFKPIK